MLCVCDPQSGGLVRSKQGTDNSSDFSAAGCCCFLNEAKKKQRGDFSIWKRDAKADSTDQLWADNNDVASSGLNPEISET